MCEAINYKSFVVIMLQCLLYVFVASASADVLKVDYGDPGNIKKIELRPNQLAAISVHVASAGEVVQDFRVSLVDVESRKVVYMSKTDGVGVVTFSSVAAGSYMVVLRLPSKLRGKTSVHVGDVTVQVLEPSLPK